MNDLLTQPVGSKLPLLGRASAFPTTMTRQPQVKFSDLATDRQKENKQEIALETAQELVAGTLVQPILDRMIEDPFRSDLFHGGEGEKMFQRQANGQLARQIVQGARFPVVQSVYQKLMNPRSAGAVLNQVG